MQNRTVSPIMDMEVKELIRRAEEKDLAGINRLLHQVNDVHAAGRPDLFTPGGKKYTDEELLQILRNDRRPSLSAQTTGPCGGLRLLHLAEQLRQSEHSVHRRPCAWTSSSGAAASAAGCTSMLSPTPEKRLLPHHAECLVSERTGHKIL